MLRLTKAQLIEIIAGVFILLFVYTGATKLMTHELFRATLSTSPLIGFGSVYLSWFLPVFELAVALLLLVPTLRKAGMVASFLLMLLFTLYIAGMLLFAVDLPCRCGGVINNFTWSQHLLFNSVLTLLALVGLKLSNQTKDFIAINRSRRKPV